MNVVILLIVLYLSSAAIDCEWAWWTEWSECSESCGEGTRTRHRAIREVAAHGGIDCEGEAIDRGLCRISDCPSKNDSINK